MYMYAFVLNVCIHVYRMCEYVFRKANMQMDY